MSTTVAATLKAASTRIFTADFLPRKPAQPTAFTAGTAIVVAGTDAGVSSVTVAPMFIAGTLGRL